LLTSSRALPRCFPLARTRVRFTFKTTPITIGFIGLGHVGKALAEKSVQVGNHFILSNQRGPSSLTGYVAELEPLAAAGKRVVFVSGDEAEAKHTVKELISAMGFAAIDLGGLVKGGRLQQAGQPLAALNLLLTN
jgi:predicted dinucleotide-binding enzyme